MIPGVVSKLNEKTVASAATIKATADVMRVTGTTQINTIQPAHGNAYAQLLILIPVDGSVILGASGNIAVGLTAVINRDVWLVYSRAANKWIINSGV